MSQFSFFIVCYRSVVHLRALSLLFFVIHYTKSTPLLDGKHSAKSSNSRYELSNCLLVSSPGNYQVGMTPVSSGNKKIQTTANIELLHSNEEKKYCFLFRE